MNDEALTPLNVHQYPREAERALLGGIIYAGHRDIDGLHLTPADFYEPKHDIVFGAIQRVVQAGNRPDLVALRMAIGHDPRLGKDVGAFLSDLIEAYPLGGQVAYYAAEVSESADLRGHRVIAERIAQMVDEGVKSEEIADRVRADLEKAPRRGGDTSKTWDDINPRVIDHIEHGARRGIKTPWPDLNNYLIGLVGSRIYVIAARPGEGKSLMGQAISVFAAKKLGKPVLFSSLEMSELDLGVRVYADQASVPMGALLSGNATPSQWEAVSEASKSLANMGVHVDDTPGQTVAHIKATARGIRGLGLIVVDYLQLVTPSKSKSNRTEEVAQITRDLKLLSKEMDVPIVELCQLNRKSADRSDKTPQLTDLRESGSIEQDADVVLMLQLDHDTSELVAHIGKNRHGAKGQVNLEMWGHLARIVQPDGKSA